MIWLFTLVGRLRRLVAYDKRQPLPEYDQYQAKVINRDREEELRTEIRWW